MTHFSQHIPIFKLSMIVFKRQYWAELQERKLHEITTRWRHFILISQMRKPIKFERLLAIPQPFSQMWKETLQQSLVMSYTYRQHFFP